jgi:hypothetical protein
VDKEETFVVKIAVPPKSPPGDYTFRLDTVWVDQTDQGDAGGAVRFAVTKPTQPPPPRWLWLIPVILVLLIGGGIGLWLLLRPTMVTVPKVTDESLGQAVTDLGNKDLGVAPTLVGDTDKPVATQDPAPGASVKARSLVTLTFPITSGCRLPCRLTGEDASRMIAEEAAKAKAAREHK